MANDYNGYIATYREYQRGDHYRKALTGWGPHSSDYIATRLVEHGPRAQGRPPRDAGPTRAARRRRQDAPTTRTTTPGRRRSARSAARRRRPTRRRCPTTAGRPRPSAQPKDIERFDAAAVHLGRRQQLHRQPAVGVERKVDGDVGAVRRPDRRGPGDAEVPGARATLPAYASGRAGVEVDGDFEAFVSAVRPAASGARRARPPGPTASSSAAGVATGERPSSYPLVSKEFDGPAVERDHRRRPARWTATAASRSRVGPRHTIRGDERHPGDRRDDRPDRLPGHVRTRRSASCATSAPPSAIPPRPGDASKLEWFCLTCSFRPWLDAGDAASATFTFVRPNGKTRAVRAVARDGRWVSADPLRLGESASWPGDPWSTRGATTTAPRRGRSGRSQF